MTSIWIDTTSGTWGAVEHSNGSLRLAEVDDATLVMLEEMSDSDIANFGLQFGTTPSGTPPTPEELELFGIDNDGSTYTWERVAYAVLRELRLERGESD